MTQKGVAAMKIRPALDEVKTIAAAGGYKVLPVSGEILSDICAAFGATVTYAKQLMHGKQSEVEFDPACPLFRDCEAPLLVARYHSLAADPATLPPELKITARTADGEVMAVQHTKYPIYGVQFHPESILTPQGRLILKNFMEG